MRAVPIEVVRIGIVIHKIVARNDFRRQVRMRLINAGIDDSDGHRIAPRAEVPSCR